MLNITQIFFADYYSANDNFLFRHNSADFFDYNQIQVDSIAKINQKLTKLYIKDESGRTWIVEPCNFDNQSLLDSIDLN